MPTSTVRHDRRRSRRWRGRQTGALIGAVALAVTACTGGDGGGLPAETTVVETTTTTIVEREDDGRLLVGVLLPVTGQGAELGQPMMAAVGSALEDINNAGGVLGNDVRTIEADEASSTALTELLDDGVDAIIGPASSLTALGQLAPAVDSATGVVVCSPSATSLELDNFPDANFLFRTVPSDSLQMAAIARQVQRTGAQTVAVGYLDDRYGRGLRDAFVDEIELRRLSLLSAVGFGADETDLSAHAEELLTGQPGVIVVLGDSDDGGRLLTALDDAPGRTPQVIVNDAIRSARTTIQGLSDAFRDRLTGIAPRAVATRDDAPQGFFAAHAVDCLNLIALAVTVANSDSPRAFRTNMASVSADGVPCETFAACSELLADGLNIDYDGLSGSSDLANSTGDPSQARFESFGFDAEGSETRVFDFVVP